MLALVAVLVTAAGADDAKDEAARWDAIIEQGETLLEAGEFEKADLRFALAADLARLHDFDPECERYALILRIQCLGPLYDTPALRDVSSRLLVVQREIHEDAVASGDAQMTRETALDVVDTLMDLGHVRTYLGDLRGGVDALHEALELSLSLESEQHAASTLARMAEAERLRGRLGPAQIAAEAAENLLAARDGVEGELAALLIVLGQIHLDRQDLARSRAYFERARKVLEGWEDAPLTQRAAVQEMLGTLLLEEGDAAGARAALIRSRDLHLAAGSVRAAAYAQLTLAEVELVRKAPKAAIALLDTPVVQEASGAYIPYEVAIVRGQALAMAGRTEAGIEELTRAAELARQSGLHRGASFALEAVASTHLATGATEKARTAVLEALDLVDGMSVRLTPLAGRETRHGRHALFELAAQVGIEQSEPEKALRLLERTRGSALIQQLGGPDGMVEHADPVLQAPVQKARDTLVRARDALRAAHTGNDIQALRGAVKAYEVAQGGYAETLERTRRAQLVSVRGLLRADTESPTIARRGLAALRRVLKEGEVYVAYAQAGGRLRAVVVTAEGDGIRDLGRTDAMRSGAERFRDEIERVAKARRGDETIAFDGEISAPLRKLLVEGLELPEGTKRIVVSPGAGMATLPFGLLTDLDLEVAVVPSATVLDALRTVPHERGKGVLAVGDPTYHTALPDTPETILVAARSLHGRSTLARIEYTRDEVEAITRDGDESLLGKDASEDGLLSRLGKKRWRSVHLACHGLLDPDRPEWSSLALTPTARSDGFLSVLEVLGLWVRADAVVLSACETGRGAELAGDGMLSLSTAFLGAGATRVVASLWQVDDEATSVLMKRFYDLWRPEKGIGAADALRRAQAHVRTTQDGTWAHPYFWAGWVLWGLPE